MTTMIPSRVSVIIPCYNGAKLVHKAISSALNQTHSDVEVIVVDDLSKDGLEEALVPFMDRIVFLKNSTNLGTSGSRNTGAAIATGKFLAFLDQDDWWPNDLLEKLLPYATVGCAACHDNYLVSQEIGGNHEDITHEMKTVFGEALPWHQDLINRDNMEQYFEGAPMLKALVHQSDFHKVGGYDNRFFGVEDFHFFVKLLSHNIQLRLLWEPKGFYLVHDESITTSISRNPSKTLVRQLRAIAGWQLMSQTIPRELPLSRVVVDVCRQGEKYWAARHAEILWKLHWQDPKTYRFMDAMKAVASALPQLITTKTRNVVQKLKSKVRAPKTAVANSH